MAANVAQAERRLGVVFCIFERKDKKTNVDSAAVLGPLERPFGFKWVMYEGAELLGEEGGYYEMPAYLPRWRKTSGSMWGYGPGNLAIPTVMTLNNLVEMTLNSAEKVIDPANLVTERGLVSNLDLSAGGITVVRDLDNSMKPYESRARFDVSNLNIEKLQASVKLYTLFALPLTTYFTNFRCQAGTISLINFAPSI